MDLLEKIRQKKTIEEKTFLFDRSKENQRKWTNL